MQHVIPTMPILGSLGSILSAPDSLEFIRKAHADCGNPDVVRSPHHPTLSFQPYEALLSFPPPLPSLFSQWVGTLSSIPEVRVAHPDVARRVLSASEMNYSRGENMPYLLRRYGLTRAKPSLRFALFSSSPRLFGQSILMSHSEDWIRQHKLLYKAFSRNYTLGYFDVMKDETMRFVEKMRKTNGEAVPIGLELQVRPSSLATHAFFSFLRFSPFALWPALRLASTPTRTNASTAWFRFSSASCAPCRSCATSFQATRSSPSRTTKVSPSLLLIPFLAKFSSRFWPDSLLEIEDALSEISSISDSVFRECCVRLLAISPGFLSLYLRKSRQGTLKVCPTNDVP